MTDYEREEKEYKEYPWVEAYANPITLEAIWTDRANGTGDRRQKTDGLSGKIKIEGGDYDIRRK